MHVATSVLPPLSCLEVPGCRAAVLSDEDSRSGGIAVGAPCVDVAAGDDADEIVLDDDVGGFAAHFGFDVLDLADQEKVKFAVFMLSTFLGRDASCDFLKAVEDRISDGQFGLLEIWAGDAVAGFLTGLDRCKVVHSGAALGESRV